MKFCTYFDHNYLPKGLTLWQSLRDHLSDFTLYVLCLTPETKSILDELNFPGIVPIPLTELESWDRELFELKPSRTTIEYYFTLTPSLPLYLFAKYQDIDWVHYLDSDLYFYQSPELLLPELEGYDCGITPHDFSEKNRELLQFGKFNVGLVSWRNSENGKNILNWYRSRCHEWCYDRLENGLFADQKYLDQFELLFEGVHQFGHKGINVAPWNLDNRRWSEQDGTLMVDDVPLIFYHFHKLKEVESGLFNPSIVEYHGVLTQLLKEKLYIPYLGRLRDATRAVEHRIARINHAGIRFSPLNAETVLWLKLSKSCITFDMAGIGETPKNTLISAIVSDYDSPETLSALLTDLVLQTIAHAVEIVVVAVDNSNSISMIVESYSQLKPGIVVVTPLENESPYQTWSRAVRESHGMYLVSVIGGYRFSPTAFAEMAELVSNHPEIELLYGDSFVSSPEQSFGDHIRSGYIRCSSFSGEPSTEDFGIMSGAPLWKHSIPAEIGFFSKDPAMRSSYSFWKLISKSFRIFHADRFWSLCSDLREVPKICDNGDGRNFAFAGNRSKPAVQITIHESLESPVQIDSCLNSIVATTRYPHTISVSCSANNPITEKVLQDRLTSGTIQNLTVTSPRMVPVSWLKQQCRGAGESTYLLFVTPDIQFLQDDWLTAMVHIVETIPDCEAVVGIPDSSGDVTFSVEMDVTDCSIFLIRKDVLHRNLPEFGSPLMGVRSSFMAICNRVRRNGKRVVIISVPASRSSC